MKIASFNVNGVKGRMPRLLEWLDETKPDIACLQEIKTGDATFPHEPLEAAGYDVIWHGMPRHHGVAILSRVGRPVEVRRGLPGDDSDGQARYLEAEVPGLRIASVYLPNGNPVGSDNWEYKLRWFARFNAYARTLIGSGQDVILCGDLNVVPTNNDMLLRMSGHEVRVAFNGEKALGIAADFSPDVAFLDIGLPGMDGYELARRLHALPGLASLRLVAVTGYGQDKDRETALAAGFVQHVTKPVEPGVLAKLAAAYPLTATNAVPGR